MEPLYEQMNKIRLLKERLEWGKYTLDDLEYIKKVLNAVVEGRDANDAFNIETRGKGIKRSDFPQHLKIMRAFHMISCAIDNTEFVQHEGKIYPVGTKKGQKRILKCAIIDAAEANDLKPSALASYWNKPKYQPLKTLSMNKDWY